jgi:hypothetical protein
MIYTNVSFWFWGAQIHVFSCKRMLRFESWSHGFFFSLQCILCCKELSNEPWTNGISGCCEDTVNFLLLFLIFGVMYGFMWGTHVLPLNFFDLKFEMCTSSNHVMFQLLDVFSWVCNRVWERMEMCICKKIKVQNKQKGVKKGWTRKQLNVGP